jgi:hypothetical protein
MAGTGEIGKATTFLALQKKVQMHFSILFLVYPKSPHIQSIETDHEPM